MKGLSDRVALSHDALTAVVTRARRVGHEGGAADDAFQTLLQRGTEASLAECQRVQDDLVLLEETRKSEAEFGSRGQAAGLVVFLSICSGLDLASLSFESA